MSGCDDACHLTQDPPSEFLAPHRESTALSVGQATRSRAKLLTEDPILLPEIVDSVFLVAVHPASDGEYEELESIGHALRLLGVRIDRASEIRDPRPLCCTLRGYTSSRILGVGSGEMNFPPNPSCLNFAASSTPMCQESSNCTSSAEVRRHHRR